MDTYRFNGHSQPIHVIVQVLEVVEGNRTSTHNIILSVTIRRWTTDDS